MRRAFWIGATVLTVMFLAAGTLWPDVLYAFVILGPLLVLGAVDSLQRHHTLRRNFPVLAHARYLMELVRPEINQYFIESNKDGVPFDREKRSIVYQRAKRQLDTLPFGTENNVYAENYEWINHSLAPQLAPPAPPRLTIGGPHCKQPYSAALLNVSAMSYGSLSQNAILALNQAAKTGGFSHNTGEGGLSPHHLQPGGDLVWQLGTAYFGCRKFDGSFDPDLFQKKATLPNVKMIEIKLSQGAKPGHGGILPASKLTPEIMQIRNCEAGKDVVSPPAHTAFTTPLGLLEFITQLRTLSGGKPIGFKLCIGRRHEFLAIVKAMLETNNYPDYITVDGAEGGTGAAPLEFSNSVGTPLKEGLTFVHNALVGADVRKHIRLIAAGKIITGFDLAAMLALGADACNCARAMMFALGCIQSLRCNTNRCPTGVATQDPELTKGLYVPDKAIRVANFHHETVRSLLDVVAAAGLSSPHELGPGHIMRRVSPTQIKSYADIYPRVAVGSLLQEPLPEILAHDWRGANAQTFAENAAVS